MSTTANDAGLARGPFHMKTEAVGDQVEHHYAELEDVRLHYVTAGTGDPVVLLHGWPQTWYCWRRVIPWLTGAGYRVVAPDLRGLGDSSCPETGYDKRTIAKDVWQLMHDELGYEVVRVVGHDMGGIVAYGLAATRPRAVSHLVVVDVTVPGDGSPNISQGGRRWHHAFHQTEHLPEALVTGREEIYLRWFYRNYGSNPNAISEQDVAEYLRTYQRATTLSAGFEFYRTLPQDREDNERLSEACRLPMPVLAVGGAEGFGRGLEVADSLKKLALDVRAVVIENSGHWIPEEQPSILAENVIEFFSVTPRTQ